MQTPKFLTPDKLRFVVVGGINTIIDFGILYLLTGLGMKIIAANFISTGIAFIFSFFANKNYTFKDTEKTSAAKIIKFIVVSLIAAWGIQPLVIGLTNQPLINIFGEFLGNLGSKCLAVGAGLIWNYILYSRFVFKKRN